MPLPPLGAADERLLWVYIIVQLAFLAIFIMLFLGFNQRLQIFIWSRDIKAKLGLLEAMANEAKTKALDFLVKHGAREPKSLLNRVLEFFVIEPVSLEPTDIIRRLEHLINVRRLRFRDAFREAMPKADEVARSKAETLAEIAAALNIIYKIVRHLLLLGEKTRNWILIMQLHLILPQILRIAETYRRAVDDFMNGVPIGDSAGPLTVFKLAGANGRWVQIDDETVLAEATLDGRKLYLIKAKGPGSTVGRPGAAAEKLVERLVAEGSKPSLILTIDAALKLEGEETGSVAEGVGAAIGDPGPEKIRFERVAAKYGIPLRAVIIKMSIEEAIKAMTKQIYEGVEKAVETVKSIILRETKPGDTVVVIGVGNTIGVGQ